MFPQRGLVLSCNVKPPTVFSQLQSNDFRWIRTNRETSGGVLGSGLGWHRHNHNILPHERKQCLAKLSEKFTETIRADGLNLCPLYIRIISRIHQTPNLDALCP